jgi:hypothetical protein
MQSYFYQYTIIDETDVTLPVKLVAARFKQQAELQIAYHALKVPLKLDFAPCVAAMRAISSSV